MSDRPTPEQIADTYQDDYSPVQYLRHLKQLGYVIVHPDDVTAWDRVPQRLQRRLERLPPPHLRGQP